MGLPLNVDLVYLYDTAAIAATSSHSLCLEMCLAKDAFRNLWKPSSTPFDWGLYGGE